MIVYDSGRAEVQLSWTIMYRLSRAYIRSITLPLSVACINNNNNKQFQLPIGEPK